MSDDFIKHAVNSGHNKKDFVDNLVSLVSKMDIREQITSDHIKQTAEDIGKIKTNIAVFDERLGATIKRVDKIEETGVNKTESSIFPTVTKPTSSDKFTWKLVVKIMAIISSIVGGIILAAKYGR